MYNYIIMFFLNLIYLKFENLYILLFIYYIFKNY